VISDQITPETPDVVIGNHTQKYTSKNPAIRWLTERWLENLEAIFDKIAAEEAIPMRRALEIGCGEGVISAKLHSRFADVTGLDLPDANLRALWLDVPGPQFLHGDAHRLPFRDKQFDLVVSVEVLEHLTDPRAGLREMARVCRRHLVVSVPREPIFRSCNLVTGRYVKDLGNTPGHLNHWSAGSFADFIGEVGLVREATKPFPWTTVWATVPD
jgi:2-polyprenyl-3-methyl-5-hydroxy-6-metoxy-1,4-benzoquinol methylase